MEIKNLEKWKEIEKKELWFIDMFLGIVTFIVFYNLTLDYSNIVIGTYFTVGIGIGLLYFAVNTAIRSQFFLVRHMEEIQDISLLSIDSNKVYVQIEFKNGKNVNHFMPYRYVKDLEDSYVDAIGNVVNIPLDMDILECEV